MQKRMRVFGKDAAGLTTTNSIYPAGRFSALRQPELFETLRTLSGDNKMLKFFEAVNFWARVILIIILLAAAVLLLLKG